MEQSPTDGPPSRDAHQFELLLTVVHLEADVFAGLARSHLAGLLTADGVTELLCRLSERDLTRLPISIQLLQAAGSRRDNVAARDGLYVAAAQGFNANLATTDERLARAVPQLVGGPRWRPVWETP